MMPACRQLSQPRRSPRAAKLALRGGGAATKPVPKTLTSPLFNIQAPLPDQEAMFYVSQVVAIFAFMYSQKVCPAATCTK